MEPLVTCTWKISGDMGGIAAAHIWPLLSLVPPHVHHRCFNFVFSSSCLISLMKINASKLAAQTFIQINGYRIRGDNLLHHHKGHSEA